MELFAIVKDLNIFKHRLLSLRSGLISLVYQFGFQGMKEAFRHGVIPAIALTAYTLNDAMLLQQCAMTKEKRGQALPHASSCC
jgi:hypothetical protein